MKRLVPYLILFFLTLCVTDKVVAAENELTFQISYENDSIAITTVERNGKPYSEIKFGGLANQSPSAGTPLLPVQELSFSVPITATDFKLVFRVESEEEMTLPYPPCPARESWDAFADATVKKSKEVYGPYREVDLIDPQAYPDLPIVSMKKDYAWAFNRILPVIIHPVQWTLNANTIKICRKLELKITWTTDEGLLDDLIIPIRPNDIMRAIDLAKKCVTNPQDVERNAPKWIKERYLK